jgi:hypothetical protein
MSLLGLLFIGLAWLGAIVFYRGMTVYGHPYDPGTLAGLAALGGPGAVASFTAYCLKKIETRLSRIEEQLRPGKNQGDMHT